MPAACSFLLGANAGQPGAMAAGLISMAIIVVFISAGIVTAVYVAKR